MLNDFLNQSITLSQVFDADFIAEKTQLYKERLADKKPNEDFVKHGCGVFWYILSRDITEYRSFGVYWWALKKLLHQHGYNVSGNIDADLARQHCGKTDAETITACELFRDSVASRYIKGNSEYAINGAKYNLFDEEMELRASIKDPIPDVY